MQENRRRYNKAKREWWCAEWSSWNIQGLLIQYGVWESSCSRMYDRKNNQCFTCRFNPNLLWSSWHFWTFQSSPISPLWDSRV
jgi:hypothetical protein